MKALDQISKAKILVIGDVMLDRYWWGSVHRISPEAPVPIVRLEDMSVVAGGAANVAGNLAGLGATPYLFGIKGDDGEAELLDSVLGEAGISEHEITAIKGRKTTIKTRIVAHHQHVVRIDQESSDPISNEDAESIIVQIAKLLDEMDAVVVSDYAKGLLSDHLLGQLIGRCKELGKPIIVDPKGRDFSKYRGATLITPNKREAAEACGIDVMDNDVVSRSGNELLDGLDLPALLITEGEHGMTLFERSGETSHFDSLARDVFDVTGAGDTVIATFAAAVAIGSGFVEAAKLANAAAGLVVGKIGTTRVTRDMLDEFLRANENVQHA